MKFTSRVAVAGMVLALSASAPLGAEESANDGGSGFDSAIECGDSVTAEILGILLDTKNIDANEYAAFCARLRDGGEGSGSVTAVSSSTDNEPTWKFEWKNGFNLTSSDDAFKLKFGGRIQLDSGVLSLNGGLKDDFRAAGIDPRHGSGTEFRRARIFFSGDVYDRVFFKAQYDFADANNPDFNDVFIGLKRLGPVGSVQVGHFKEPLFLQESTSTKHMTFMERGLNSVFFPGRNVGAMAAGNLAEKKVFWQLGIFRDTDDQGSAFDQFGSEKWDIAGRLSGAPIYSHDGEHVLHLGAGYIHRFLDSSPDNLRFRARPAAHLAQRFADTQSFPSSETDILNVEFAYVHGPFSAQAEFTNIWIEGAKMQRDLELRGAYTFVSYFLTGEHRVYDLGKGRFGRVKPKKNFDPGEGDWGAVEIAVRYSYLDLVNNDIDGGDLWDVTVGINWYLFPNLRWMLNYVHADVSDRISMTTDPILMTTTSMPIAGAADIVESRIQIDF